MSAGDGFNEIERAAIEHWLATNQPKRIEKGEGPWSSFNPSPGPSWREGLHGAWAGAAVFARRPSVRPPVPARNVA